MMSPQAEWVCHNPCGELAAWRGHSSSRKQQPGTTHSFCLLPLITMYYVVVIYYHHHHHNDQPPSCSQRREPPSCNLQGLLHPGMVGQGGPLCRICTWFNICTFWSYCIFFWILTPCHNIQSDPSEAHSSDHRRGEWTSAWDRPLETSYYYNIKRSLWQFSSKSEEDEPSPDKWAKEEYYIHKISSRFHLGWPRLSTSSWLTTIMILVKQSYDCDLNPPALVSVMYLSST